MSVVGSKLRKVASEDPDRVKLAFWCPGCDESHVVSIGDGFWQWNGDGDRPTFDPSVLVRSGHYVPQRLVAGQARCWCTHNAANPEIPAPFKCRRCHGYVTDGTIRFLTDSTHALAGQTVPLPDFPGGEE